MTTLTPPPHADKPNPSRSRRRWWLWAASILATVGIAIALYEEVIEEHLIPTRWGTVEEGLIYRSGQLSPTIVEYMLRSHEIDVVISLSGEKMGDAHHEAEAAAAAELGIRRENWKMPGDGVAPVSQYVGAIKTLVEASRQGKQVLVHCYAGTYRTGGVVACYRILVDGWTPQAAYEEMLSYDVERGDNLPPFLAENIDDIGRGLIAAGVIDRLPDNLHFPTH